MIENDRDALIIKLWLINNIINYKSLQYIYIKKSNLEFYLITVK